MMTRKDYEKAASIAHEVYAVEDRLLPVQHSIVVQAFVDLFRHDNPRFDVKRFRKACGQDV